MANKRREAFAFFYTQVFSSPDRERWPTVVSYLAQIFHVPNGSRDAIYRVFEDCEEAESNNVSYSSSANAHNSGRHRLIIHGTTEANLIYNIMEQGLGSTAATFVVNAYLIRNNRSLETVSLHAVKRPLGTAGGRDTSGRRGRGFN